MAYPFGPNVLKKKAKPAPKVVQRGRGLITRQLGRAIADGLLNRARPQTSTMRVLAGMKPASSKKKPLGNRRMLNGRR